MGVVLFGKNGSDRSNQMAVHYTLPEKYKSGRVVILDERVPHIHIVNKLAQVLDSKLAKELKHTHKASTEIRAWEDILVYGLPGKKVVGIGPIANLTTFNLPELYINTRDSLPEAERRIIEEIIAWRPINEEEKFRTLQDRKVLDAYLDLLATNINRENGKEDVVVVVDYHYLPGLYDRLKNKTTFLAGHAPQGFKPKTPHNFLEE